jgi:hypothetical protein
VAIGCVCDVKVRKKQIFLLWGVSARRVSQSAPRLCGPWTHTRKKRVEKDSGGQDQEESLASLSNFAFPNFWELVK